MAEANVESAPVQQSPLEQLLAGFTSMERRRFERLTPTGQKKRVERFERELARQRREANALSLRALGYTYQAIAEFLGISNRGDVWKMVDKALEETRREPSEKVRDLEIARLDAYLLAIRHRVAAGELQAIDRALHIGMRRAALLGLDVAVRVDATIQIEEAAAEFGLDPAELAAELQNNVIPMSRKRRRAS